VAEFSKCQRVRVTAEYATIDGESSPDLEKWVGCEGTIIYPREWPGGYDVVLLDDPPEESPFGFRYLSGELEAIEP